MQFIVIAIKREMNTDLTQCHVVLREYNSTRFCIRRVCACHDDVFCDAK